MIGKNMTPGETKLAECLDKTIKATEDLIRATLEADYSKCHPQCNESWCEFYAGVLRVMQEDRAKLFTAEAYKEV